MEGPCENQDTKQSETAKKKKSTDVRKTSA